MEKERTIGDRHPFNLKPAIKLAFVIAVTALAWFNVPAAIVAIAASILVALHGKAGTIIELSFGPLKAKLEREVSQAEKLVNQLREFAALQAKAVIAASVRTGRWASESDWLFHQVKAMETSLREMGVSEEKLVEARREFVTYTIADAGGAAIGAGRVPSKNGVSLEKEWREAMGSFPNRNADKIEAFLAKHDLLTSERSQVLADMGWMMEHNDVRDAEQYLRAQKRLEIE